MPRTAVIVERVRALIAPKATYPDGSTREQWEARIAGLLTKVDLPRLPDRPVSGVWAVTMVKDEADIIERTVRQLFGQGVAGVLVSDNGSTDETPAILARLARQFPLYLATDREPAYYQAAKMTLLADWARRAGASWIIPFDADELWFAPDSTLAVWLASQSADVVRAEINNVFPTADGGWAMDVRPHLHPKVAFRAHPDARLSMGNHSVSRPGRTADGLHIAHVPWRSFDHFARKVRNGLRAYGLADLPVDMGVHWRQTGSLPDEALALLWEDLLAGHGSPSLGWSPAGRAIPVDVDAWLTWADSPLEALPSLAGGALTVMYAGPADADWEPAILMARLAARLLGGGRPLEVTTPDPVSRLARLARGGSGDPCLVIAARPEDLRQLYAGRRWLRAHSRVVGWVLSPGTIDPAVASWYDHLFVAGGAQGADGERLDWGADVLGLPAVRTQRRIDVLGSGLPDSWTDEEVAAAAAAHGLTYLPTSAPAGTIDERRQLADYALSQSRFALVFRSTNPSSWTNVLAAGTVPAGPRSAGDRPDPMVVIPDTSADSAMATLASAPWTSATPVALRREALSRLDWRWRFAQLRDALGISAPGLDAELSALESAIRFPVV